MRNPSEATQDSFIGALLGLAIGDALGMPAIGLSTEEIHARFGQIDGYHGRTLDSMDIKPGEITDESEIALCIVESLTTNQGELDAENVGARLLFLAKGESRRWMSDETLAALDAADSTLNFEVPLDEDAPSTGDVATRGVPIGLLHAVGQFDGPALRADAEVVTRLTHGSPSAIAATTAVAYLVNLASRHEISPRQWAPSAAEFLGVGELAEKLREVDHLMRSNADYDSAFNELGNRIDAAASVSSGLFAAMTAQTFEETVFTAVNAGGATDTRGALAGAIYGAHAGAGGIPQWLIDGLESRIYVSLAAPWFYKVVLRRSGQIIDLRPRFDDRGP